MRHKDKNIKRDIWAVIIYVIIFISLFIMVARDANAEAGWQVEPCMYSESNDLCKDYRKAVLSPNQVVRRNKIPYYDAKCHTFAANLRKDLYGHDQNSYAMLVIYRIIKRHCLGVMINMN